MYIEGLFDGQVDDTEYTFADISGMVYTDRGDRRGPQGLRGTPILPLRTVEDNLVRYQSFSIKDWGALLLALQRLTKGGIPWLRALVKATAGEKLCFGDIHAALIKSVNESLAKSVHISLNRRTNNTLKKYTPLSDFHEPLEEELGGGGARFPCIMTDELMSLRMKDSEDYYAYKQRAKTLYHDAIGEPLCPGTGQTLMFYSTLVKGMPKPVKLALEDEIGLYNKSEEDFDTCCNHRVNRYLNSIKDNENKRQDKAKKRELEVEALKLKLQKLSSEAKDKRKATQLLALTPEVQGETPLSQQPPQLQVPTPQTFI